MANTTNILGFPFWFNTDNKEGVDLNNVVTFVNPVTSPELPSAGGVQGFHPLGTRVQGNNGSEWVRVQASTTVSANDLVAIDVNFACNPLTTTLASSLVYTYGLAAFQTSVANGSTTAGQGDLFWCMLKSNGGAVVNVSATAARGVQLFIATAQAGAVTSTSSGTAVKNLFINTSLVAATAAVDCIFTSYLTVST